MRKRSGVEIEIEMEQERRVGREERQLDERKGCVCNKWM